MTDMLAIVSKAMSAARCAIGYDSSHRKLVSTEVELSS